MNNFIKIDYDNINVEDIMRQIKENIKLRNIDKCDLQKLNGDFKPGNKDEFDLYELTHNVVLNNMRWEIRKSELIKSHRKLTGPFIVLLKRLIRKISYWYVQFLFDQQIEFNASITNSINNIEQYIKYSENRFKQINDENICLRDKVETRLTEIGENKNEIERIKLLIQGIEEIGNSMEDIQKNLMQIENNKDLSLHKVEELNNKIESIEQNLLQIEKNVENSFSNINNAKLSSIQRTLEVVSNRLRRIEHHIKYEEIDKIEVTKSNKRDSNVLDMDYFLFESLYRGSRDEIKERQKIYLKYFMNKNSILDIGCGKGEFIELLLENGINAEGIDIDKDNINYCVDRGLPVKQGEALEYLAKCNDNSLGGIFMGQVIEHLTPADLIVLIRLARKKLQADAYFIAETINPQCLMVYIESFYMDPTHTKPVHPLTVKFLVESEGFIDTDILYMSPVSDDFKIPGLEFEENCKNINEFNAAISRFNDLMYGNRDYAIIAKR